jgi:hypothetical protein
VAAALVGARALGAASAPPMTGGRSIRRSFRLVTTSTTLLFKAGPAGGSDTRELDGEPPGNTPITEGELLNLSSQPGAAMRR